MPVNGIVLFAKTSKALVRMNEIFRQRRVSKIYEAMVENVSLAGSGLLTHWLKRDERKNFSKAYQKEIPGSEKAILKYEMTGKKGKLSLLRIELLTGRKHQIRAQFAAIGHPIAGDIKYGASSANQDGSIHLSAVELTFIHPVKKEKITITLH